MQVSTEMTFIPPAYRCTSTKNVMQTPVMALCGHLFEKSVVEKPSICPVDQWLIDPEDLIPQGELKQRIEDWKLNERRVFDLTIEKTKTNLAILEEKDSEHQEVKNSQEAEEVTKKYDKRFYQAHNDDIHALLKINEREFLSGSKDTSIRKWNHKGVGLKTLYPQFSNRTYKSWITALGLLSNGYWLSGTRDGVISVWNKKDRQIKRLFYSPGKKVTSSYQCKDRNRERILCISEALGNNKIEFYTGTPGFIQLWDLEKVKMIESYRASKNDWVYCIEVLENQDLLTVIGSKLEYWNLKGASLTRKSLIMEERNHQACSRPHISSIVRLEGNRNRLGCSLFDGSVRVIDIFTRAVHSDYREHVGRVWSVINVSSMIMASGADDKTVKIWDLRNKESVMTLGDHPGRVSSLLKIEDYYLVSGSCADNPYESQDKGVLTYWDLRSAVHPLEKG